MGPPKAAKPQTFKVVLLGDSSVGKTCLLRSMLRQSGAGGAGGAGAAAPAAEMNSLSTVGVDLANLDVRMPGDGAAAPPSTVRLQLWDTAGQEKYRSIAESFYRGAAGIILVYDVTKRESFLSIGRWLESIAAHTAIGNLELVLVGNKTDLLSTPGARAVTEAAGREAAAALDMPFFEASALSGANVVPAVDALAARLLARARAAATSSSPSRAGFAPVDFVSLAEKAEAPPPAAAGGCEC